MILIVSICKNKLHKLEFVRPIEMILKKNEIRYDIKDYKELNDQTVKKVDKIIIAGTSLKDNDFLDNCNYFNWIKGYDNPILGICGGMHILGLLYYGKMIKSKEIGLTNISLKKPFFNIYKDLQVYELHNYFFKSPNFEIIAESKNSPQITIHKNKPFYGILFHPEVRNQNIIKLFANQ